MKRPANPDQQPSGCYHYTVPETGIRVPANGNLNLVQCVKFVAENYTANGYAVPVNLDERIMDYCCQSTGQRCIDASTLREVYPGDASKVTRQQAVRFLKTMLSWGAAAFSAVSHDLEHARAETCLSCPKHVPLEGCAGCAKATINNMISRFIVGRRPDERLQACGVCGCLLKVKVRIPRDVLLSHTPADEMPKYPAHCWFITEGN